MSSAHDLPSTISPETAPEGPHLSLVPPLAPTTPEPFDLDRALAEASPRLQRYATRRLGSSHEAEEVVQEALLRAYQHRDSFASSDDLMAWSTVVTGRLVIDRVRVRGRSVSVAELPEQTRVARDAAEVVVARDEARTALDALESMPTRQAAVLWAREVEGQSYDEIAERYGLSEPTVRSLLHRARKTLRREYAARGGTLPAGGLVVLAPWLQSLHGLGKLREAIRRAATSGAALSVAGLTALGVIALAPPSQDVPTPNVQAKAEPIVAMPPVTRAVVSSPTTPTAVHPRSHSAGTKVALPPRNVVQKITQVVPCTETGARTVLPAPLDTQGQQVNCRDHRANTVYVGPELPDNPTGVHRVGASTDLVDCKGLPPNLLVECTAPTS